MTPEQQAAMEAAQARLSAKQSSAVEAATRRLALKKNPSADSAWARGGPKRLEEVGVADLLGISDADAEEVRTDLRGQTFETMQENAPETQRWVDKALAGASTAGGQAFGLIGDIFTAPVDAVMDPEGAARGALDFANEVSDDPLGTAADLITAPAVEFSAAFSDAGRLNEEKARYRDLTTEAERVRAKYGYTEDEFSAIREEVEKNGIEGVGNFLARTYQALFPLSDEFDSLMETENVDDPRFRELQNFKNAAFDYYDQINPGQATAAEIIGGVIGAGLTVKYGSKFAEFVGGSAGRDLVTRAGKTTAERAAQNAIAGGAFAGTYGAMAGRDGLDRPGFGIVDNFASGLGPGAALGPVGAAGVSAVSRAARRAKGATGGRPGGDVKLSAGRPEDQERAARAFIKAFGRDEASLKDQGITVDQLVGFLEKSQFSPADMGTNLRKLFGAAYRQGGAGREAIEKFLINRREGQDRRMLDQFALLLDVELPSNPDELLSGALDEIRAQKAGLANPAYREARSATLPEDRLGEAAQVMQTADDAGLLTEARRLEKLDPDLDWGGLQRAIEIELDKPQTIPSDAILRRTPEKDLKELANAVGIRLTEDLDGGRTRTLRKGDLQEILAAARDEANARRALRDEIEAARQTEDGLPPEEDFSADLGDVPTGRGLQMLKRSIWSNVERAQAKQDWTTVRAWKGFYKRVNDLYHAMRVNDGNLPGRRADRYTQLFKNQEAALRDGWKRGEADVDEAIPGGAGFFKATPEQVLAFFKKVQRDVDFAKRDQRFSRTARGTKDSPEPSLHQTMIDLAQMQVHYYRLGAVRSWLDLNNATALRQNRDALVKAEAKLKRLLAGDVPPERFEEVAEQRLQQYRDIVERENAMQVTSNRTLAGSDTADKLSADQQLTIDATSGRIMAVEQPGGLAGSLATPEGRKAAAMRVLTKGVDYAWDRWRYGATQAVADELAKIFTDPATLQTVVERIVREQESATIGGASAAKLSADRASARRDAEMRKALTKAYDEIQANERQRAALEESQDRLIRRLAQLDEERAALQEQLEAESAAREGAEAGERAARRSAELQEKTTPADRQALESENDRLARIADQLSRIEARLNAADASIPRDDIEANRAAYARLPEGQRDRDLATRRQEGSEAFPVDPARADGVARANREVDARDALGARWREMKALLPALEDAAKELLPDKENPRARNLVTRVEDLIEQIDRIEETDPTVFRSDALTPGQAAKLSAAWEEATGKNPDAMRRNVELEARRVAKKLGIPQSAFEIATNRFMIEHFGQGEGVTIRGATDPNTGRIYINGAKGRIEDIHHEGIEWLLEMDVFNRAERRALLGLVKQADEHLRANGEPELVDRSIPAYSELTDAAFENEQIATLLGKRLSDREALGFSAENRTYARKVRDRFVDFFKRILAFLRRQDIDPEDVIARIERGEVGPRAPRGRLPKRRKRQRATPPRREARSEPTDATPAEFVGAAALATAAEDE